ncbi:hypothetical protein BDV12DRAFT_199562 [Aspergillus spectabilis]
MRLSYMVQNISRKTPWVKTTSDQEGVMEPVIDLLAECHPCYFHMRIFGEADYFMISDLKDIAKEQFRTSFTDCSERDLFAEVIKELYLERANYQELRTVAIEVVVNNLPSLRKGFDPAIDSELLEAVPNFAVDLCLATIYKYSQEPSSYTLRAPCSDPNSDGRAVPSISCLLEKSQGISASTFSPTPAFSLFLRVRTRTTTKLMAIITAAATPTPIPALAPVESELDGSGSMVLVAVVADGSAVVEVKAVEPERVEELVVEVMLVVGVP